jgi:hypothetical protein
MKPRLLSLARVVSLVSLVGTIVPPLLFFIDRVSLPQVHDWMMVATVAWFASASVWMEH